MMNNESGSITGLVQFILCLVFAFASYEFCSVPIVQGCLSAVQSYWTVSGLTPSAAYASGLGVVVSVNSSTVIGILVFIMSALAFLIHDLRNQFQVT